MKFCFPFIITALSLVIASHASAQQLFDWADEDTPVVVQHESSVLFVGKDGKVKRVYNWRGASGSEQHRNHFLADLDLDNKPNFIGAGRPTFVLAPNSDPMWFIERGCDQVLIADIVADNKLDLMCLQNGNEVRVYTHDGQFAWSASLGQRFEWCALQDINGDLKADVECKHRGRNAYSRFDGSSGRVLAERADDPEVTPQHPQGPEAVSSESLKGQRVFAEGNAVIVRQGADPQKIEVNGTPVAILEKDLNKDGKKEIVILTTAAIVVADHDGTNVRTSPLAHGRYTRHPVAELRSVYAIGFEDNSAAQQVITDANQQLSQCYSTQVRRNQFAGTGQVLLEVIADGKGGVGQVNRTHSALADGSVVDCARTALRRLKLPANAEGESGRINVTLFYTFEDR